jgi:hypothetical protein
MYRVLQQESVHYIPLQIDEIQVYQHCHHNLLLDHLEKFVLPAGCPEVNAQHEN